MKAGVVEGALGHDQRERRLAATWVPGSSCVPGRSARDAVLIAGTSEVELLVVLEHSGPGDPDNRVAEHLFGPS